MRLALFEPDIPQNTGAVLRLAACMGVGVDVIEPCGFVWTDRHLRRAGMDYLGQVDLVRHASWSAFLAGRRPGRLLLLSTSGASSPWSFAFARDDILLLGSESAGVTPEVRAAADAALRIPMRPPARALNVALAATLVLGEALRQTQQIPDDRP
jgi:tRNA (cytidine/uridine-2'-O-)-methyltransferase